MIPLCKCDGVSATAGLTREISLSSQAVQTLCQ